MKYDLQKIMYKAWEIYRKGCQTFAEALHRAWNVAKAASINDARVQAAKAAAGVTEDARTWHDWKVNGYEVIHGSKAVFQAVLIWASKGDGKTYKASFFTRSQVKEMGVIE